jgi:hypothetical protein
VKRERRDAILRQGVVLPETPRERRDLAGLAEDIADSPAAGRPLPLRQRNFRPSADSYLAALGGPLAYMVRLRRIDELVEAHREALIAAWRELAESHGDDPEEFAQRWEAVAAGWAFDDVNDLIARHNRWYPVESRLPMDPARRDYALVNGRDYRRGELDASWVLEQLPARLDAVVTRLEASAHAS